MKINTIHLSIIIPIYNAEKYISRCIESILPQLHNDEELILIDDGATDISGKICDEYSKNIENIVVVHQKNQGESGARNTGLKVARGEYIIFVDADDFADEHMLLCVRKQLNSGCDVILFEYIEEDGKKPIKKYDINKVSIHKYSKQDSDYFIKCNFFASQPIKSGNFSMRSVWAKAYRREFLLKNNLYFDKGIKIGPDMLYTLKAYSLMESAMCVEYPVYHYFYKNPTSITNIYKPDLEQIIASYCAAIEPWLEKHPEYIQYHANYRLNDIVMYMKFDFFHNDNKESKKELNQRMHRIILEGKYPEYYQIAKKHGLLQKNKISQRIVYAFAINGFFVGLRLLAYFKYHFGKKE